MMDGDLMLPRLREYVSSDRELLNDTVLMAFEQYSSQYNEWGSFLKEIGSMSSRAGESQIIIAEFRNKLSGAVAYYGPGTDKTGYFPKEWASIRLLVVNPECRGNGIGSSLMEECILRAENDAAPAIGLHTSDFMEVALSMYLRMGFDKVKDVPEINGVAYSVYKLQLSR